MSTNKNEKLQDLHQNRFNHNEAIYDQINMMQNPNKHDVLNPFSTR